MLCQHGNRQVARMDAPLSKPKAKYIPIADRYEGKRLNSPNDLVYHTDGSLYFTDPPYGLTRKMEDPDKQLDFQGVYRVTKDGQVTLLTKDLSRPNGLSFSPDHRTLYVANSDAQRAIWMAYDVKPDGAIANGRVFFDATSWVGPEKKGLPDGMKIDAQGHLFATGPGGVHVFDKDGKRLGTFATGEATSNCAFGEDGSTLFITADMYVLRLRLKVKGAGF
jgi:gluconolactonase